MFLKFVRLIVYSLKGNYSYAFGQFGYTRYLRRKRLHIRHANKIKHNKNAVVFDLKYAKDRYAFNIINTYKLADFDIYLKPKYKFYSTSQGLYFEDIFSFLDIGFFKNAQQLQGYENVHYVYDYPQPEGLGHAACKSIEITDTDAIKQQSLKFPFGFHPNTYKRFNIKSKEKLNNVLFANEENNQNAYKIVFAGSTNGEDYNNIKDNFIELIDRNTIFNEIRAHFNSMISVDYRKKENKSILISDSLNAIRINEIDLFKIFKNSDFFIAPPGFEMPFCHNLYEAMSCGLIPIIQYSDYLYPNLENDINCLTFASVSELQECINKCLHMESSQIKKMKANVLKYYKNHMLPSAFVNKIENQEEKTTTIFYVSGITN